MKKQAELIVDNLERKLKMISGGYSSSNLEMELEHMKWFIHHANLTVDTSQGGTIHSNRTGIFAKLIVFTKKVVRKLLKPITKIVMLKQVEFNGYIVNYLNKAHLLTERDDKTLSILEEKIKESKLLLEKEILSIRSELEILTEENRRVKTVNLENEVLYKSNINELINQINMMKNEILTMFHDTKSENERLVTDNSVKVESKQNELETKIKHYEQYMYEQEARLINRMENIRGEIFHEIKNNTSQNDKMISINVQYRASFYKKEKEMGDNIRINLGCGRIPKQDYINIDGRPLDAVDLVADVTELPFEDGTISEIYSAHLVEHFEHTQINGIVDHWYKTLKTGGKVTVICPDWTSMMKEYVNGNISFEDMREVTFGGQEYAGNYHYNMFSPESLTALLISVGFKNIKVIELGRKNGACLEMEIRAEK
ncbi:methyltransferase domain-containing protein [Paenibacillus sp. UMB4589-SE434]|uniref:class I SAM-dependent methyltransferase n=1 Tax=Paenibacillus sp. UMB4589-SE434 TaxID=3046314 RepID=UPI00254CD022|nr:methyltransferase domain-containing protein [Paenibacillus sp. UMB4589-SE434]MDK8181679.1 hypothetical protein [Paenibacillus sp. UMB4589-SE434]